MLNYLNWMKIVMKIFGGLKYLLYLCTRIIKQSNMGKKITLFSDLRKMTGNCISQIVSHYGSPDEKENIVLDMKSDTVIHTFYGLTEIKTLIIRTDFEGTGKGDPELQFKGIDEDNETQVYTVDTLPIEGCIELIDHIARQFELDELEKTLMEYVH
jgi:hypothetical protein